MTGQGRRAVFARVVASSTRPTRCTASSRATSRSRGWAKRPPSSNSTPRLRSRPPTGNIQQPPSFVMNKMPRLRSHGRRVLRRRTAALTKNRQPARLSRRCFGRTCRFNFGVHYFHAADGDRRRRRVWIKVSESGSRRAEGDGAQMAGRRAARMPPARRRRRWRTRAARPACRLARVGDEREKQARHADIVGDCTHWLLGVPKNGRRCWRRCLPPPSPLRHRRSMRALGAAANVIDLDGCLLQLPPNATSADAWLHECKAAPIGDALAARGGVMPTRPP